MVYILKINSNMYERVPTLARYDTLDVISLTITTYNIHVHDPVPVPVGKPLCGVLFMSTTTQ